MLLELLFDCGDVDALDAPLAWNRRRLQNATELADRSMSGSAGFESGIGDADGLADGMTSPVAEAALDEPMDGGLSARSPPEHAAIAVAVMISATPDLARLRTAMSAPSGVNEPECCLGPHIYDAYRRSVGGHLRRSFAVP